MANDQPPDGYSDHPPDGYSSADSKPPDGFENKPSMLQSAAQATGYPERLIRGRTVGIEHLFTGKEQGFGNRMIGAADAEVNARKPDYVPQKGEKIGNAVGQFLDPRFLGLGEVGSAMAAAPLMKAVFAGGVALGGQQVIEDFANRGKLNLKGEGIAAAEGAAGGAVLHGAVKAAEPVIKGLAESGGKFVNWILGNGKKEATEAAGDAIKQTTTMGGSSQSIIPKDLPPTMPGAKTGPPHALFAYNDNFGPDGAKRSVYNVFGDPTHTAIQARGWGSSVTEADLKSAGIPITGQQPGAVEKFGNPIEMGPPADPVAKEVIKTVEDHVSQGKTISEISSETGLDKKVVQQSKNLSPPIEMTPLTVQDAAAKGDPAAQLNVLQKAWKYWTASATEASSTAKNLFRRRYGEIGVGYFDSRLFIRDATGHLNDIERQAMPFIIEGKLPNPEKFLNPQAPEILDTAQRYMQNPNDPAFKNIKYAHEKIGSYMDEGHEFLKEHFDEMGYKENYINHLWERNPKTNTYGPSATSLSQKNPFTKARTIGSYAEGIDSGHTPKTLDISELLKAYDNFKIKSVANMRFRESLEDIVVEGGRKAVLPLAQAPPDWKYVDSHFFTGTKVSPEVFDAVRAIVDKPYAFTEPGPNAPLPQKAFHSIVNAYEYVNAVAKKVRLSASFFHHLSLTETAIGGGVNPLKVLKDQSMNIYRGAEWDGWRELPGALLKSFMEGHAAFNNIPVARDAVEASLQIGSIADVQRGKIVKLMTEIENQINEFSPAAGTAFKGVRKFNEVWDKALWDYYHAGIKLQMYQQHLAENIKLYGDKMPLEQIKWQTANAVNNATGGALETMMYSPKFRQALQWAFLAPDWTITRLQTVGMAFKGGPEGYQSRKFLLRSAVAFYSTSNVMNYVNTSRAGLKGKYGSGRFMWENDPGKELSVFSNKGDDGRNQYIMTGKPIVEVVRWFEHPLDELGAKASPSIQMMAELYTYKNLPPEQKGAGKFIERNLMPFSLQGKNNIGFTLPKSNGISKTQVIQMIQDGIQKGDTDALQKAIKFGIENGYDVSTLRNIAIKNVRSATKKSIMNNNQ